MPVRITCPHCQRDLRLPEELYDGPAQCPACKGAFAVSWPAREPAAPAAARASPQALTRFMERAPPPDRSARRGFPKPGRPTARLASLCAAGRMPTDSGRVKAKLPPASGRAARRKPAV